MHNSIFLLSTEFDNHARNFSHFKVHHHSTRNWNRNFSLQFLFSSKKLNNNKKKRTKVKIYVTQKMQKEAKETMHAYVLYHTIKYIINYLKNLHCWILLITLIILHVFQEGKLITENEHNLNKYICRFIRFFRIALNLK